MFRDSFTVLHFDALFTIFPWLNPRNISALLTTSCSADGPSEYECILNSVKTVPICLQTSQELKTNTTTFIRAVKLT